MVKKKTAFLASNLHRTIVDEQRMYVEIPVRQTPYQINTKEKQVSKTKENKTKKETQHTITTMCTPILKMNIS